MLLAIFSRNMIFNRANFPVTATMFFIEWPAVLNVLQQHTAGKLDNPENRIALRLFSRLFLCPSDIGKTFDRRKILLSRSRIFVRLPLVFRLASCFPDNIAIIIKNPSNMVIIKRKVFFLQFHFSR